jgi:hypothetical protein
LSESFGGCAICNPPRGNVVRRITSEHGISFTKVSMKLRNENDSAMKDRLEAGWDIGALGRNVLLIIHVLRMMRAKVGMHGQIFFEIIS